MLLYHELFCKLWIFGGIMQQILLTMGNAVAGQEDAYVEWFRQRHLGDVLDVPGVLRGTFYRRASLPSSPGWDYCALYELDRPVSEVFDEIGRRVITGEIAISDTADQTSMLLLDAVALGKRRGDHAAPGDFAINLVMSNPAAGQEDAYNHWYSEQHLDDVLRVPGHQAAQRYRLSAVQAGVVPSWAYLAIYSISRGNLERAHSELMARAGGDEMPVAPSLDKESLFRCYYEPLKHMDAL